MAPGHEGDLTGFAEWFSGTMTEKQSFEKLSTDLEGQAWAVEASGTDSIQVKSETGKGITEAPAMGAIEEDTDEAPDVAAGESVAPLEVSLSAPDVGDTAPLTEEGYTRVFSAHSDEQMRRYVERVLAAQGKEMAPGHEGDLMGFAQWFSGTMTEKQSFEKLSADLEGQAWAVEASDADSIRVKSETGTGSTEAPAMDAVEEATDEAPGVAATEDVADLEVGHSASDIDDTAPLTEEGYARFFSAHSDEQTRRYVERVVTAQGKEVAPGHEGDLTGFAEWFRGASTNATASLAMGEAPAMNSIEGATDRITGAAVAEDVAAPEMNFSTSDVGDSAPLTEEGYTLVFSARSDEQMRRYVERILAAQGKTAHGHEGALMGFAKWFSGTRAKKQSFLKLWKDLQGKAWAVEASRIDSIQATLQAAAATNATVSLEMGEVLATNSTEEATDRITGTATAEDVAAPEVNFSASDVGDSAPLTEDGYTLVFAARSDEQMRRYIDRVLAAQGKTAHGHEGALTGFTKWFSGTRAKKQSFLKLWKDLQGKAWAVEASGVDPIHATSQAAAATNATVSLEMGEAAAMNSTEEASDRITGAAAAEDVAAPEVNFSAAYVGDSAPLTEEGYTLVFSARSDEQMRRYIERILAAQGKTAHGHEGALMGFTKWFSGTRAKKQSFLKLWKDLQGKAWAVEASGIDSL